MIVSIAEEMNPTRRNTMEDVHIFHGPSTWKAPNSHASFVAVCDGHGGRRIVDYLEDHFAENVAQEWTHSHSTKANELKCEKEENGSKKRRRGSDNGDNQHLDEIDPSTEQTTGSYSDENSPPTPDEDSKIIQQSLERAFLLTDIQSRLAGINTSGATVVCCIIIPEFSSVDGSVKSISIHAANAGDARAVLSSCTASVSYSETSPSSSLSPSAIRITHDHKSTDPSEMSRIESSGGIVLRGRVLGVLAVARSIGDHGLKDYVIGKPHLSTTTVRISKEKAIGEGKNGADVLDKVLKTPSGHPFTDGEFLIVACDGLWDVIEDQEAVDLVRSFVSGDTRLDSQQSRQEKAAHHLIEVALKRGSTDNITVIVCWL